MKRMLVAVGLVTSLAGAGPASAQTAEGSQSQGTQQGDAVQIGAGTKGDVTPGSSGPQLQEAAEALRPFPLGFSIRPPVDPFYGPAMLPIARGKLRCELIGPAAPKRRCEAQAQSRTPG